MAKEGSTVSGLMDSFALTASIALQHGVPLKLFCSKFSHTRFEPSGWSGNPDIGYAGSLMDYIFRWLALKFLPRDPSSSPPEAGGRSLGQTLAAAPAPPAGCNGAHGAAPVCQACG